MGFKARLKRFLKASKRGINYQELVRLITKYFEDKDIDSDKKDAIDFLQNRFEVIPYSYIEKYDDETYDVERINGYRCIEYNGKKLYYSHDFSDDYLQEYHRSLLIEQDIESPHRYFTESFTFNKDDVFFDIGAAEANMSLSIINEIKHAYMFEMDEKWNAPLRQTFSNYNNKVTIINKFVSDKDNDISVKIDSIIRQENLQNESIIIKIDAEGTERKIIRGMSNTLRKHKKLKILICTYHRNNDEMIFSRYLRKNNMTIEVSDKYMLYPWINGKINIKPPYFRRGLIRASRNQ